ncbi:MAG: diacylglycerol kinase [Desulfobacterales bacterium]|jgi:diacylglycerol kinase (ATP)
MRNKFLGTGEFGYHPVKKIKICIDGIYYAARFDFSFAYKMVLSIVILITCFILRQWLDFFFILTATALVLMAELFNSAIEALCDFVEISKNEKIKVIKDISASAVGIGILLWAIIIAVELVRLWLLFVKT